MICPACRLVNASEAEECFGCGMALFALTQGRVLADRYEIRRLLGQGGMGRVYEAFDRTLEERVAVKVLRPQFAREPEMARRFLLEIRLARRITHPNVCRLHEYGESDGIRYLCMELVDGVNLKDMLRAKRLSTDEAYEAALAAALGLEAVHAQGVIHRDFKTANIMLDGRGQVKVMDFGIAKEVGADTTGVSLAGHVLGTPEYMSPEHVQGGPVDFRSDLYALGCVIFEVFAGRALFQGTSPIDTLRRHLHEPVGFSNERGLLVPEPLVPVLRRALAKKPDQRYASITDLVADLRAARDGVVLPSLSAADGPLSELLEAPEVDPSSREPSESAAPARGSDRSRGGSAAWARARWLLAAGLVAAIATVAWWRGTPPSSGDSAPEGVTKPSLTTTAPPTTVLATPSLPPPSITAAPTLVRRAAVPARRVGPTPAPSREPASSAPPTLAAATRDAAMPSAPVVSTAPKPTPPPEESGVLKLIILPPSEVTIDEGSLGIVSSQDVRLSPGSHDLRVEHPDYLAYKRKVTIRAGTVTDFVLDLSEKGIRKVP
jgi:eukaryotic-like serine/threonine-protein kinase